MSMNLAEMKEKLTTPLKVIKKTKETENAFSFELEIPQTLQEKFEYRAGQFVTLFLEVNNEWISRSYSLSTSPTLDANFQITVKRVEGGRGSNYLADKVNEGDTLNVTPPQGTFFQPLENKAGIHYFLFAAGSGITPIYSIAKEILYTQDQAQVYLLFSNRNENEIIYKEQLESLQSEYKHRFFPTHMFSQPKAARLTLVGRCSSLMAKNFVIANSENATERQAYMCGPEGFMDEVFQGVTDAQLDKDHIRRESFATVGAPPKQEDTSKSDSEFSLDGKVLIGEDVPVSTPSKIQAIINGETIEVTANADTPILESLIEAGQNPPYSCMNGSCMACMAKITKGRVYQEDPGILTDENIEVGEALTCQAKPLTEVVVVDYDDF